jgi:glycosyltransferase involved in cell wall biosynthesis
VKNTRPLVLFEFGSWGHIPNYLRLIFDYWAAHENLGRLHAVVGAELVNNHATVFESLSGSKDRISISAITPEEEKVVRRFNVIEQKADQENPESSNKYFFMWSLVQQYLERINPHHALFLTLDELILPLCAGLRSSTEFSGIFFRPFFQYQDVWAEAASSVGHLRALPGRLLLNRFLSHPQLRHAFCIDETVPETVRDKVTCELVYLPDPVRIPAGTPSPRKISELRRELGIPAERKVFLFAGDITERKGLWNVIRSIYSLDDQDCARICVAIVGKAGLGTESRLDEEIARLGADKPISFVRRAAFVSDRELESWFAASDVVLAPYNKHVGMSGILLLAAAHGRPVISQAYGLMGDLTRRHELGQVCEPADPSSIAAALRAFLHVEPNNLWNENRSARFAKSHSQEKFAEVLFGTLFPSI